MAATDELLDTNILVYAFTTDTRSKAAKQLLAWGCSISVRGLNEFANVAHRKLGMSWGEIGRAIPSSARSARASCRWMQKPMWKL